MAELHDLTVAELRAAARALTRENNELAALAKRFEDKGDLEAAYQVRLEDNDISTACGFLLRALRNREKEDREREHLEQGDERRESADPTHILQVRLGALANDRALESADDEAGE